MFGNGKGGPAKMILRVIHRLQYDFVQQGGLFLVIKGDPDWQEGDLARLPLNMIRVNAIPGLLPLRIEMINLNHTVHYEITARKMLGPALAGIVPPAEDYYRMLHRLVSIITNSKLYMLDEERYLIHEDFIFIGKELWDVSLAYIPISTLESWPAVLEQFTGLVGRTGEGIPGVETLLAYLNGGFVSLHDLREQLDELIRTYSTNSLWNGDDRQADPVRATDEGAGTESGIIREEAAQETGADPAADAVRDHWSSQHVHVMPLQSADNFIPFSWRQNTLLALCLVAGAIAIWGSYVRNPVEEWFYICTGLTLLLGDAGLVISAIWRPRWSRRNALASEGTHASDLARKEQSYSQMDHSFGTANEGDAAEGEVEEETIERFRISAAKAQDTVDPIKTADDHYANLHRQTTLLMPEDATVVLTSAASPDVAEQAGLELRKETFVLVIASPKGTEKIRLNEEIPFKIGRDAETVHYVLDVQGVSRIHAQLFMEEGQWFVQDLGSLNGSLINGRPMIAYKSYLFQSADTLKIISAELSLFTS